MKGIRFLFILFLIAAFCAGIYVCMFHVKHVKEGLRSDEAGYIGPDDGISKCPDLLISSGNKLLLYNTTLPQVPNQNPIVFDHLDGYIQYLESQKKNGQTDCPVLYLQQSTDTQGRDVYKIQPRPQYWEKGLPPIYDPTNNNIAYPGNTKDAVPYVDADRLNPPYNSNQYFGFDPQGQYVGRETDVDKRHHSTQTANVISDNPMDPNWGGVAYTQAAVDSGKYIGEEVVKPVYQGSPNTAFHNIDYDTLSSGQPSSGGNIQSYNA
jgi:hypothetical protein